MSFYLKPPRGSLNFHIFQQCVEERLNCYRSFCNNSNVIEICNYECLMDDSPLDRTGHYLFRLYAHFSTSFRQVFLRNERKLLLLRLSNYNKDDVRYFLKRTLKQSKDCLNQSGVHTTVNEIYNFFYYICSRMLNRKHLEHIFKDIHLDSDCQRFTIRIPFYLCPSLISRRKVSLINGYAGIQCSQWKDLLLSVYETYLRRAINEMKYSQNVWLTANDTRIRNVFQLIQNHYFDNDGGVDNELKFDISNIDVEAKLFPLCMMNLFKVLQKTNRLSHNDRFDFSLYMKGIGITLTDSMKFWENAYTKQHSSCSKCSHNWKDNEKRYIYSIRHLYGLEGSRKNYSVRSCNYFQEKTLSAIDDGGCPFKHFDDNNLRLILKKLVPNKEDDIEVMIYERKENPMTSCKTFYELILKTINNYSNVGDINFANPVQYYLSLKKQTFKTDIVI